MTTPSTEFSRTLYIGTPETITEIRVLGHPPFVVDPPFVADIGMYRAELDPETHTATITEEES